MIYSLAAQATVLAKPSDIVNPKPNWGAFNDAGTTANSILGFVMAAVIVVCIGMVFFGIAKQRFGSPQGGKSSYAAEEGKGLIVSGLVGLVLAASAMKIADAMWVLPGVG